MKTERRAPVSELHSLFPLLCGIAGSVCFAVSDWLMLYGNSAHSGSLFWLTQGVVEIAPWRNALAMMLAFPGTVLDGIALFSLEREIRMPRDKARWRALVAFGLTPWMALHLFCIMILYLFRWLTFNGFAEAALPACEALFAHLSFLVPVCMVLMVPPFVCWFHLQLAGKTAFPRGMAWTNMLLVYALLSVVKMLLPESAFRLGFTNALMNESMLLWFALMGWWKIKTQREGRKSGTLAERCGL